MSKEIFRPSEGFDFTKNEELFYRVSQKRFQAMLDDEQSHVHELELSYNDHGEFLFVTLSHGASQKREIVTFYGLGFHQQRERWLTDEWFWYRTYKPLPQLLEQVISKAEAKQKIQEQLDEIRPHLRRTQQSERGKWFEVIADMTDEDDAITFMEDHPDFFDDYE